MKYVASVFSFIHSHYSHTITCEDLHEGGQKSTTVLWNSLMKIWKTYIVIQRLPAVFY